MLHHAEVTATTPAPRSALAEPTTKPPGRWIAAITLASIGLWAGFFGPIQVQTNWWVFRIDKVDNEFEYSDAQKGQLAQIHLDQAIKDKQAATNVKRNLTGDDRDWAVKNAN